MTHPSRVAATYQAPVRAGLLVAAALTIAVVGGCAGSAPAPLPPPAAAPTQAPAQAGPPPADGPADVDPVAFFRAQQQPCGAHAEKFGNSPVEPERFTGAKLERALGDGEFLVTDGLGTRVVVRPADGVVLPESGSDTDVMPVPYNFGCPSDVFVGASED